MHDVRTSRVESLQPATSEMTLIMEKSCHFDRVPSTKWAPIGGRKSTLVGSDRRRCLSNTVLLVLRLGTLFGWLSRKTSRKPAISGVPQMWWSARTLSTYQFARPIHPFRNESWILPLWNRRMSTSLIAGKRVVTTHMSKIDWKPGVKSGMVARLSMPGLACLFNFNFCLLNCLNVPLSTSKS